MCEKPSRLPTGQLVGCRKCWQCRERKVLDWVGRCIAESKVATSASVVTLTYGGGDNIRAAVLTYSDVQKWFKVLRKRGYVFKYFLTGEYGAEKGRAHWHVIIYWHGGMPPHVDRYGNHVGQFRGDKAKPLVGEWSGEGRFYRAPTDPKNPYRYWDPHWPHGHMVWDVADAQAVRYACKYVQKGVGEEVQGFLAMSKKPPLGDQYFRDMAARYVEQGLAPQTLEYQIPGETNRDGKPLRFFMSGTTANNFIRRFIDLWRERRGPHVPNSVLVEEWEDRQQEDWHVPQGIEEYVPTALDVERAEYQARHAAEYFDYQYDPLELPREGVKTWRKRKKVTRGGMSPAGR